jgi:hypothetical protein
MSGDDLIECFQTGDWLTVLTRTQFGHIWLFRVIVSLVFGIILWLAAWTCSPIFRKQPGGGGRYGIDGAVE